MKLPFIHNEELDEKVKMIDIEKITPNPYQPRENFMEDDIIELAESIKNFGLIQPLTIRTDGVKYELVAGERRLRAVKYLGHKKVPAIIKKFSNQEAGEISLVENLQRKDLNFIEEAMGYKTLLQDFNLTQEELAKKLGKSQSTVANKLRILKLPIKIRKELQLSEITERHARVLLKLDSEEEQMEVIKQIKQKKLTVRETQDLIKSNSTKNKKKQKVITLCKDIRVFANTLNKTIKEMKSAGLEVKVEKKEKDKYVEYKIRLPRNN